MITKFNLYERIEDWSEIWHIGPVGNIEKYSMNKQKYVSYNRHNYDDINLFLEWMYVNHINLEIKSGRVPHNYKANAIYTCAVRFSNFYVKGLCTWTQYTIGEGFSIDEAIINFMNIVRGKTILSDGGGHYDTGEEIEVPDDFELWLDARRFNL